MRDNPTYEEIMAEDGEPPVEEASAVHDPVNHPQHYTSHPSGIECIQITEHMDFCLGSALKYIWRAGLKGQGREALIEDLEKARWYLAREITLLQRGGGKAIGRPT